MRAVAATLFALVAPLISGALVAGKAAAQPGASLEWRITGDFESPESAAISAHHSAIFVSNVKGYERNGQGFISKLSLTGEMLELQWLTGINAPTGLTVDGDTLWAVDFDRLLEIDIPRAQVRAAYPAPDDNPLLNDVAVGPAGTVFVTGSASNSVYELADGGLSSWMRDNDALQFANGIMVSDAAVMVAAYHLMRIDRVNKTMQRLGPADILYDLEGVKPDGTGGWYVSVIGDRPLYHLAADGVTLTPIFKSDAYLADFDIWDGILVGPTGPSEISGLRLAR